MDSIYRSSKRYQQDLAKVSDYWAANGERVVLSLKEKPGSNYQSKRGAMVVDAICSRQRKYDSRVLNIVREWQELCPSGQLKDLIQCSPESLRSLGLLDSEPQTLIDVAEGFFRFGQERNISAEDEIVKRWASEVKDLRHFTKLDPYVGSVSGVGPALFAYMRMLCGADTLKVDLRVNRSLRDLGTFVPSDANATLHLCELYAEDLGISLRQLDRLLYADLD